MNNDIRLFQLNSYVRPKIVEVPSKDWVLNGRRNEFYQDIIDAYNGSPTNTSVINSFVELCYGNGLVDKSGNTMNWVKLVSLLKPNELKKILYDFVLFGEASIQIIKTKGKKLSEIAHIPKQLVVPNKVNEDGEIEMYWYSEDWSNTLKNIPVSYPAFGTSNEAIEIYCIKPYKAGKKYFSDPDWLSIIPYCQIEEEIANFYIKSIKQGLSAGYIINVPDGNSLSEEEKTEFERQIKAKLTGSPNAMNFVLSFNGRDAEITIVPFPVNAQMHKQWEFLTAETTQKILTGHRCTSPSLVGIISSSGFSNTADEMDMAEKQLIKRVIQPKQNYIIDALYDILEAYDINLDLSFKPLTEEIIAPNKTELSNHVFDKDLEEILLSYADNDLQDFEDVTEKLNEIQLSAIAKSEQDTEIWKIRYAYAKGTSKSPRGGSRSFCNIMTALSSTGKVYRKEDIDEMSAQGINGQFAHQGGKYDIFLYGGGVNCYHRWERRIFKKRLQENGKPYIGNALQNTDEVNVNDAVRQGAKLIPNDADVAIAEIDKPNKGRY
jgi:hypothetical protein